MPVVATAENACTHEVYRGARAGDRPDPDTVTKLSESGETSVRRLATLPLESRPRRGGSMDDAQVLTELNLQFIEAFRRGSWELLEPILSPSFRYLDGATGEVWAHGRYVENLRSHTS